jgi:hypothetical protein
MKSVKRGINVERFIKLSSKNLTKVKGRTEEGRVEDAY